MVEEHWSLVAATKPKPKKPRKPEEIWYDVHKHPDGVPGGMGRSPEYHLRNRGWNGHEINEGTGKKTIQYRNHEHPDFVISYGGGISTKPDHNFRVLYMGTNTNIPRVTRSYSVAEAMNKVDELHQLHNGLVVQPMTHGAAAPMTPPSRQKQPGVVPAVPKPAKPRDMTQADAYPEFPNRPQGVSEAWNDRHENQLKEIPDPPAIKPKNPVTVRIAAGPQRMLNEHGTLAARNRHRTAGEQPCRLCRMAKTIYDKNPELYRNLVADSGGLTEDHLGTTSPFHDPVQQTLVPRVGGNPRHPEGQGPADLGRAEYLRRYRTKQREMDDTDVAQMARQYGMDISPEEVPNYRGLRKVVSAVQMGERATWEDLVS